MYADTNKNGRYDAGEQTFAGIMVTNGFDVVKTNSKGEFLLPEHKRQRFITITTPSGYKASSNYYQSIDKSVKSYDFSLNEWSSRIAADGAHRFIQLTDTEIFNTTDQERWAENVRDYAYNEDVAFLIHTGDICYESGLKNHIHLMNSNNMGLPVYYMVGNHDLVKGEYGEQLFESIYGPSWYSFDYGNVHYIVTPMAGGDHKPGYTQSDIYEWLHNDLALIDQNKPVIFFNHDLISNTEHFIYKKDVKSLVDLSDYNLKAYLYGHWHINYVRMQGKTKTICTSTLDKGGIDHSTNAFRVVDVAGSGDVSTQLRYTYVNQSVQISSVVNHRPALSQSGELNFVVNAYHSVSPVKSVSLSIVNNNGENIGNQSLNPKSDWSRTGEISLPKQFAGHQLFAEATVFLKNGEVVKCRRGFVYDSDRSITLNTDKSWPALLGGASHVGIVSDQISAPFALNWVANVGANLFMSSPVVDAQTVFVASVDEDLNGKAGVFALDIADGHQKWFFASRNSIKNSIALDGGRVLAQDADGWLYALDATSGRLAWEVKMPINGLPALVDGLTATGGVVYAGSGKGFGAWEVATGRNLWLNSGWRQGEGTTSTASVGAGVVLSGSQWGGLHANDIKNGKHLWTLTNDGLSNRGSTPAIIDGVAWLISSQSLFNIDVVTGKVLMKHQLPFSVDVTSTPLVTSDLVVFGTVDDGLVALNRQTMQQKWRVKTLPALIYTAPYTRFPAATIETSPVMMGSHIVFGASDGVVYVVDAQSGKVVWNHNVGAPVLSTVATSGNALFVTDFGGNVYALTFKE